MVLNASFNELVFENRHKKYGAYQIRKRYRKNVWLSVGIAVTFFSSALILYMGNMPDAVAAVIPKTDSVKIVEYHSVEPKLKPIIQPSTPTQQPKTINQPDPNNVVVTKDSVLTKTPVDSLPSGPKGLVGPTGPTGPTGDPNPCVNCDSIKKKIRVSDNWEEGKPPIDPGIDEFFRKNIKYPEMAKDGGIEGTVWLSFIVNSKGEIRDIKIVKSAHPWLDREVMRVASVMPKWIPVKDADESVEYIYRKPVRFTLN